MYYINVRRYFSFSTFRAAGIACVVISGVVKNGLYVVGERCLRRKREKRSQWNAVLIDGEWRLLDVLWASCALVRRREKGWKLVDVQGEEFEDEHIEEEPGEQQHRDNEFFFLTDPDWFVSTHFPDDPDWQLLPRPLSIVQFETIVYIRERFFDMGLLMQPDSQRYCVLQTNKGEVTISFGIPQSLGDQAQFSYMLQTDEESTTDEVTLSGQNAEDDRAASVMDSLSQFSEEADEPVTPQRDDTGKPDDTTCVWCDTCEDSYGVDLPQSEHKLMIAAERKAAQHSTDYIEMKRTGADKGDVVNVILPKNGDYIIDVFDLLDNNLLDHVRCTHVTRLVEKVTHLR